MKQKFNCACLNWQHKIRRYLLALESFVVLLILAWQVAFTPVIAQEVGHSPTFSNEVVRILQENCQQCHQPGGIAPMPLETFEQAKIWAPRIKYNVNRRVMPPWHLDSSVGETTLCLCSTSRIALISSRQSKTSLNARLIWSEVLDLKTHEVWRTRRAIKAIGPEHVVVTDQTYMGNQAYGDTRRLWLATW